MKGEIEEGKPISANLALASPLLSRFDLIFLLLDRKRGDSWDSEFCFKTEEQQLITMQLLAVGILTN